MSYKPFQRTAILNKKEQEKNRIAPYKAFAKEQLEKFNVGLISADEYYSSISNAKLLFGK